MRRLIFIGLAVALGVGCGASLSSTVKERSGTFPSPDIRLGPMIPVTGMPVEKVRAAMDNVGRVHLLVAMKSPKVVEYVVVDPDSGTALLVFRSGSQEIRDDRFGLPSRLPLPPGVAWATDNGLVGRWVEPEERKASGSSREKPEFRIHQGTVPRGGMNFGVDRLAAIGGDP